MYKWDLMSLKTYTIFYVSRLEEIEKKNRKINRWKIEQNSLEISDGIYKATSRVIREFRGISGSPGPLGPSSA